MSKTPHDNITDEFAELAGLVHRISSGEIGTRLGCEQLRRRLSLLHGSVMDLIVTAHIAGQEKAEDNVAKRLGT